MLVECLRENADRKLINSSRFLVHQDFHQNNFTSNKFRPSSIKIQKPALITVGTTNSIEFVFKSIKKIKSLFFLHSSVTPVLFIFFYNLFNFSMQFYPVPPRIIQVIHV